MIRRLIAALIFATSAPAMAAPLTTPAQERAYTLALMCAGVAAYDGGEVDGRRTMEAAIKVGAARGISRKKVSDDLFQMAKVLGVAMRDDPTTMEANRATCRRLRLIG